MATAKTNLPMSNASGNCKTFTRAVKKTEKHLLLSTTYGLNSSATKKIVVGLGVRGNDEFEPVIKLLNNSSGSICLKLDTWTALTDAIALISDYSTFDLYADVQWHFEYIELGECRATYTTAHGAKAVRVDVRSPDGDRSPNVTDNEDSRIPSKLLKLYHPLIVMQKTTFHGLKSISVCVNERVRRLQRLAHDVNKGKKLFVAHIAEEAKTSVIKESCLQSITQIVVMRCESARDHIKPLIYSVFRENYLDIVLPEISRLYSSYVADEAQQLLEAQ